MLHIKPLTSDHKELSATLNEKKVKVQQVATEMRDLKQSDSEGKRCSDFLL